MLKAEHKVSWIFFALREGHESIVIWRREKQCLWLYFECIMFFWIFFCLRKAVTKLLTSDLLKRTKAVFSLCRISFLNCNIVCSLILFYVHKGVLAIQIIWWLMLIKWITYQLCITAFNTSVLDLVQAYLHVEFISVAEWKRLCNNRNIKIMFLSFWNCKIEVHFVTCTPHFFIRTYFFYHTYWRNR